MKLSIYGLYLALGLSVSCQGPVQEKPSEPSQKPTVDSLEIIRNMIRKDSLDPGLWKMLYAQQLNHADTTGALATIRHYSLLVPEDGEGWLQMAWLLANRRDPAVLVITDSLNRVKDESIRTRALFYRGLYYSNIHDDDRAIRLFDSTIVGNYTFIDAYIEKGIIQHDRKQYALALKTFQQAFNISSSVPDLYYWIGKCYEGLGNPAEAADWQKKYEALK